MTKDDFKTGIQRAVKLEQVPPERFGAMVLKTVIGAIFVLIGAGLLYGMVRAYLASNALSIPLLATGGAFLLIGSTVWSGQLVTGALKALLGPFSAYRRAIKGERE